MSRIAPLAILATSVAASFAARAVAADGPWMVRVRALYLQSADKSDAIPALAVPSDAITVEKSALDGPVDIGSFKHLPPTLSLQYHFAPDATFRPCVGAGFDWKVDRNPYVNFDVKKVYIGSDVKLGGNRVSEANIDPRLWSPGQGWRF